MGFKLKKYGPDKIIPVVLAGVLLMLLAAPRESTGSTETESYEDTSYTDNLEQRLTEVLEKTYGEGTIYVMINAYETGDSYLGSSEEGVEGVLVISEAYDEKTVSDIISAVTALFDVPSHRVKVLKMN